MKLHKGQKIILSERGHNNFYYPSSNSETLMEDTEAVTLSFCSGSPRNLKAVKILRSAVFALAENDEDYLIAWIEG